MNWLNDTEAMRLAVKAFHVQGAVNLKDFTLNLFLGIEILRKLDVSDQKHLEWECGERALAR